VEKFTEPADYYRVVLNPVNIIQDVTLISETMVSVTYTKHEDFVDVMQNTNPVIAAFTTAIARLKLMSHLKKLGKRVLYFDTDSIIYRTSLDNPKHKMIETGYSLGEMTNELKDYGPDAYISEFVSGGPKNYAYKVDGTSNGKKHVCMKVKGISLSATACKTVNFNTLKRFVKNYVLYNQKSELGVVAFRIETQRKGRQVVSRHVSKKFRVVYDKRTIREDFTTYPYGW